MHSQLQLGPKKKCNGVRVCEHPTFGCAARSAAELYPTPSACHRSRNSQQHSTSCNLVAMASPEYNASCVLQRRCGDLPRVRSLPPSARPDLQACLAAHQTPSVKCITLSADIRSPRSQSWNTPTYKQQNRTQVGHLGRRFAHSASLLMINSSSSRTTTTGTIGPAPPSPG